MVNNEDILVLFDIDGTMLQPGSGARKSMAQAIKQEIQDDVKIEPGFFAGKTDILILSELLRRAGYSENDIPPVRKSILKNYIHNMKQFYNAKSDARLYPGVIELIDSLRTEPNIHMGLLTGNIEEGARIKLGPFGLNEAFPVGAYGEDGYLRTELTAVAVKRSEEYYGVKFLPHNIIVIGDTVEDIKCSKVVGARTIAVSQHLNNENELYEMDPDHVFFGFENYDEIREAILNTNES